MNIIDIPFVEKIGIRKSVNGEFELPFNKSIHNHLATIHVSAQFALAETSSGEILQILFPELSGKGDADSESFTGQVQRTCYQYADSETICNRG